MPNVITHYLFARDALDKLPLSVRDTVSKHAGAYYLGAEGPDAFYPLRELGDPAARLANRMHRGDVCRVFQLIAEDAADPRVLAYGLGLMTHYVLDKTMHPLVYFLTEEGLPRHYDGAFQQNLHNLAESAADDACLLLHQEDTQNFDVCRAMGICKKDKKRIAKLYHNRICPHFGYHTTSTKLGLSFTATNLFGMLWRDKRGKKRKVLCALEQRFSEKRNLASLLRPVPVPRGADLLNAQHTDYPNPRNSNTLCHFDFFDAYRAASAEVPRYLCLFADAVAQKTLLNPADFAVSYEGIDVSMISK